MMMLLMNCTNIGNLRKEPIKDEKHQNITKSDNTRYNDLLLISKSDAIKKYGEPHYRELFTLNDAQGEFRIELNNIYSKEDRLSESIIIEELTWEKDRETWITVWYEINKIKAKDFYIWKKGTDF